jgi:hypothetical protein
MLILLRSSRYWFSSALMLSWLTPRLVSDLTLNLPIRKPKSKKPPQGHAVVITRAQRDRLVADGRGTGVLRHVQLHVVEGHTAHHTEAALGGIPVGEQACGRVLQIGRVARAIRFSLVVVMVQARGVLDAHTQALAQDCMRVTHVVEAQRAAAAIDGLGLGRGHGHRSRNGQDEGRENLLHSDQLIKTRVCFTSPQLASEEAARRRHKQKPSTV